MTTATPTTTAPLAALAKRARRWSGLADVAAALRQGKPASLDGVWGSSGALVVAALSQETDGPIVVVLPNEKELDAFAADAVSFGVGSHVIFPAWDRLPEEIRSSDPVWGSRLRVVSAMEGKAAPKLVITTLPALLQPVPSRESRTAASKTLSVGQTLDVDAFLRWLVDQGFERVSTIASPGEVSCHGGILDVFSPDAADPVRIELYGDEIDSLRTFDVETQRKLRDLHDVTLTVVAPTTALLSSFLSPCGRGAGGEGTGRESSSFDEPPHPLPRSGGEGTEHRERPSAHFLDTIPANSWIALFEPAELNESGKHYLDRLDDRRGLFSVEATWERVGRFPAFSLAPLLTGSLGETVHLQVTSIERFTGTKGEALRELAEVVQRDEQVVIACHNEGARERLAELLHETDIELAQRVGLCVGSVSRGFRLVSERTVVLSDNELFGRVQVRRAPRKRRHDSRAIDSFLDLSEGDLVVHLSHGIARYRGMKLLDKDGQKEEHLHLEFRDGVKLFVPVTLIHLVQKYIGGGKVAPELSKLGGLTWAKRKKQVAEAVADLASDMIRLQAERETKPGFAYPPDSHWQQEFEAAFPYTETDDQLRAIADCKDDLMRGRPMDRLICGDVGYGKTEVAMRAAFKAVDAGKQVAVLVPTTVLAEQHFRSFSERMAEFPVTLASLSRFKSKAEQREVLQGLEQGTIDIVIGTHRLIQPDVRFKDIGLLIIDEEQRFGVEAKEMLKRLRLEVDVLTLSATPIPRTLHMSLVGIRDISNLETPPQDRLAVETRVSRFDADLIRHAIIRELNRNGQVYFVHNRVYNIQTIAERIRTIVPEATVDIMHGQMHEDDVEAAMLGFVSGRTDVLVATTIIESGLDIPNANTIFIHQADKYGLSDLHQLRGRVGRYKHRAYCYLLLEEGRTLTPQAARRLKAIEEFSELGAGFKIAMRDLEIRGAGNILGTEQSGHIAAVGYELYCQLLENAVRALKQEPLKEHRHVAVDLPVTAYLPDAYVPPGRFKIEMYRKLSGAQNAEQLAEVQAEFRDRFGPWPAEVDRLFQVRELQLLAQAWQVDEIRLEGEYAVFGYRNPRKIQKLAKRSDHPLRIVDDRFAYLVLPSGLDRQRHLIDLLKAVLQRS
jgi:transcription-repair coupling factor (superfamily II helicase)